MEAVVDVKYRPALYRYGGMVEPTKFGSPASATAWGEAIETPGVYLECLRNHAASAGGYVVDGCGEFMPAPAGLAADPAASLRCAACGCHRSFHRRVITEIGPPLSSSPPPRLALLPAPPAPSAVVAAAAPHLRRGEGPPEGHAPAADGWDETDEESSDYDDGAGRPMSPLQAPAPAVAPPSGGYVLAPAPPLTLLPSLNTVAPAASVTSPASASALAAASSRPPAPAPQGIIMVPGGSLAAARKRFRTKFSPEQKQRMRELSERLGWRLQKRDEAAVEDCCREIGVARSVFKVWMHNNKHNFVDGNSARRAASSAPVASMPVPVPAAPVQPSAAHTAAADPPPAASAPPRPPVVHADFNINNSGAADYYVLQPVIATTMSGGAPQHS